MEVKVRSFSIKIVPLIIIGVLALLLFKSFTVIETGKVGIKSVFGKYDMTELQPGLHFVNPLTTTIKVVDTKVHAIHYKENCRARGEDIICHPPITVLDSRGLPITVELSVLYRLNPESAAEVYAKWGDSWESKLINPAVRSAVRDVMGKYAAEDVPSHRADIERQIISRTADEISKSSKGMVQVVQVNLRNIQLPESVYEKIKQVQQASLEAQRMKQEILIAQRKQQKEKIEAETEQLKKVIAAETEAKEKIARAKGEAEARLLRAKAEAEALRIKAEAQAKANLMIAKSLTPELLRLKEIEATKEIYSKQAEVLTRVKDLKIWVGAPKEGIFVLDPDLTSTRMRALRKEER